MIQIDDKIISLDLFTARFRCDLGACRGECCVEGNAGAPSTKRRSPCWKPNGTITRRI